MAADASDRVKSAIMPAARRTPLPSADAPNRATVAVGFVTGLLSGLRPRRIEALPLLRAAGLSRAAIEDPHGRVPLAA